jgi:Holliday junction DNA helicase RuvA
MIALLNGSLIRQSDDGTAVILDDIRIGHEVMAPVTLPDFVKVGCSVSWWIIHHVTQDSQTFYAFLEYEERELAKKLTKVQGIGMRVAHRIVTTHGYQVTVDLIAKGDPKALAADIAGFGPKGAKALVDTWGKDFKALCSGAGDPRIPRVKAALGVLNISIPDEEIMELCRTDPDATDSDLVKAITSAR